MDSLQADKTKKAIQLGEFRIDPQRRTVSGPTGDTTVEPKVMAVLLMLAGRPGEVVTRQEFLDSVWATEFGGDESLTRAVSQLRKIFGDGRGVNTYIETVPKTGYRLVAPVELAKGDVGRTWRGWRLAASLVMVLAVVLAVNYVSLKMENRDLGFPMAGRSSMLLAVLPFNSQSEVTEDMQLAHGLSHEIESTLRQSPSTSVIVGRYPPQLIGSVRQNLAMLNQQFNISHVIDGEVQRTADSLQVVVRLIDIRTGQEVWSDVVVRPETELNTIPGIVAAAVQSALGEDSITIDPEAASSAPMVYEGYLQAKGLARASTEQTLTSAVGILERVVEMEPKFSEAWAALAWARFDLYHVAGSGEADYQGEVNRERIQAARRDANTALAIDPNSIDAQLMVAVISIMEETDTLVESESRLLSLLAASPNHPNVNFRMGLFLMSVGRWQESVDVMRTALQLDPFSGLTAFYYTTALLGSERTEEFQAFLEVTGSYRYYRRMYTWLGHRLEAGDFQAAREFWAPIESDNVFFTRGMGRPEHFDPDGPRFNRLKSLVDRTVDVAESGDPAIDPALASEWIQAADEGLIAYHWVVGLLGVAGFNDAAIGLIRARLALGEVWYREVVLMPGFKSARQDTSIMTLFQETGQLDYWLQTGKWPDFCKKPDLPYDCVKIAKQMDRPSP